MNFEWTAVQARLINALGFLMVFGVMAAAAGLFYGIETHVIR